MNILDQLAAHARERVAADRNVVPEEALKDKEGLQTMRNLARNMIFLMKAIADAKEKYGLPEVERAEYTNFADGK